MLFALATSMRLSLMKAAHADVGGAPWQEIRGACRFRRPIPFDSLLDALEWACEIPKHHRPSVRLFDDDRLPL
jgi:hypothetical protein